MKRGPGTQSHPSKTRRRPRQKWSGGTENLNLAENSQTRRTRTGKSKHKEAWHSQRVLSQRGGKVQVRWWGGKQSNGCFYTDGRDSSLCVTDGNDRVQRGILTSWGKYRRTSGTRLSTGQAGKVSSGQREWPELGTRTVYLFRDGKPYMFKRTLGNLWTPLTTSIFTSVKWDSKSPRLREMGKWVTQIWASKRRWERIT